MKWKSRNKVPPSYPIGVGWRLEQGEDEVIEKIRFSIEVQVYEVVEIKDEN